MGLVRVDTREWEGSFGCRKVAEERKVFALFPLPPPNATGDKAYSGMVPQLRCSIWQGSVKCMLTSILLDKEGLEMEVLQRTSTALSTDWHPLVLQVSLKVWWQLSAFPPSQRLGHCICDPLLLPLTMAGYRKQQRCERICLSSHLRVALVIWPNPRKWLACSASKSLCEQKDRG